MNISFTNSKEWQNSSDGWVKTMTESKENKEQYQNKHIIRYFAKKTTNNIYTEINEDTYKKFLRQESTVLWELYQIFQMKWIIKL